MQIALACQLNKVQSAGMCHKTIILMMSPKGASAGKNGAEKKMADSLNPWDFANVILVRCYRYQ